MEPRTKILVDMLNELIEAAKSFKVEAIFEGHDIFTMCDPENAVVLRAAQLLDDIKD